MTPAGLGVVEAQSESAGPKFEATIRRARASYRAVTHDFCYLSLGAGVQSTALLVLSALGLCGCPRADCAIFADTQDEPAWVYDHLKTLTAWAAERGLPVHVASRGCLSADVLDRLSRKKARFAAIPAWTRGRDGRAAHLQRQCTREYKVEPLERKVRELLGYRKRQRTRHKVACLLGISTDEVVPVKPSRTPWVTNLFPLVDAGLSRDDCAHVIREAGLPVPERSACVFCPYHDDRYWASLLKRHPEEFARASAFDLAIRDMRATGIGQPVYLHRSLGPLGEIDFSAEGALPVVDPFNEECDGRCGV